MLYGFLKLCGVNRNYSRCLPDVIGVKVVSGTVATVAKSVVAVMRVVITIDDGKLDVNPDVNGAFVELSGNESIIFG